YGDRLAAALEAQGLLGVRAPAAARVHGHTWVEAVELADGTRKECDLLAACAPPLPSSELLRPRRATVGRPQPPFAAPVAGAGATSAPGVLACGEVTGVATPQAAAEHGAQVGARL